MIGEFSYLHDQEGPASQRRKQGTPVERPSGGKGDQRLN